MFLVPHRTCFGYLLELPFSEAILTNKYPNHMFLKIIKYNILALCVTNCYLLSEGFMSQIGIITNFIVVSSFDIERVVCIT